MRKMRAKYNKEFKELLYLVQVANSSFPTGSFNHSYGFETLISQGKISNAETLQNECKNWLLHATAPLDGAAVVFAHRAALDDNLDQLVELDNLVEVLKLAREVREASYKIGYAFLNAIGGIFNPTGIIERYIEAVKDGRCKGNQSVAFGAVSSMFGVNEEETVLIFFHSALSNLIAVAARIIPLGQTEVQRIIANSWSILYEAVKIAQSRHPEDFGSTAVAIEIAAMKHERLYSRLCMS